MLYLNSGIIPKPTTSDDKAVANVANPIDVRDDIVRIDHKFNDKWTILGHYMHDTVTQGYGVPFLGWLWASYNTVTSTLSNPSNSRGNQAERHHQSQPAGRSQHQLRRQHHRHHQQRRWPTSRRAGASARSSTTARKLVPGMDGGWGTPYNVSEEHGFGTLA